MIDVVEERCLQHDKGKNHCWYDEGLMDMHGEPSTNKKVFLMQKLFYLKMIEGDFVATHLNEFKTIVNQMLFVEINFEDEI